MVDDGLSCLTTAQKAGGVANLFHSLLSWLEHSVCCIADITSQLLDTYDKEAGQQEPPVPHVAAFRLQPARGGRANAQVIYSPEPHDHYASSHACTDAL